MKKIINELGLNSYDFTCFQDEKLNQDLVVEKSDNKIKITYRRLCHLYRSLGIVKENIEKDNYKIEEKSFLDNLAYQVDVARDAVPTISTLKKFATNLALLGYSQLYLYLEDLLEVNDEPYFGHLRGRYSKEEIKELDKYCLNLGIELIPSIQTLAHLNGIFSWPEYSKINDINDILLVKDERTYKLIDHIFDTIDECFTTKKVHIGMDEAHLLGRGKYLDNNKYETTFEIMIEHLKKVKELADKHGYQIQMWSDMFFRYVFNHEYYDAERKLPKEITDLVPEGISQVYWDYVTYDKKMLDNMFENHKLFKGDTIFASGAWKWNGWPPQNQFSTFIAKPQIEACKRHDIKNIILTAWADDGAEASIYSTLPTMIYYAEAVYSNNVEIKHLNNVSEKLFGVNYKAFLDSDLIMVKKEEELCDYIYLNYGSLPRLVLYTDPFSSYYNELFERFSFDGIQSLKNKMHRYSNKYPNFSLYFKNLENLCSCLLIKANLSKDIRKAYFSKNHKSLDEIANKKIPILIKRINIFMSTFEKQWLSENKTNGFEVHCMRLGGLKERLEFVRRQINKYLAHEIDEISEITPFVNKISDVDALTMILYATWKRVWTVNVS